MRSDSAPEVARQLRHREALSVARAMVRGLSIRRVETREHQERLAVWSRHMAEVLGLGHLADGLELGAILHDLGMSVVPDRILEKDDALTTFEWAEVRKHPLRGAELISDVKLLSAALPVVLAHHEKWDGTGYPNRLRGAQIPLPARIFAVCDAFEAITQDRPYRRGAAHREALELIEQGAGSHFDPEVVSAFLQVDWQVWARLAQAHAA